MFEQASRRKTRQVFRRQRAGDSVFIEQQKNDVAGALCAQFWRHRQESFGAARQFAGQPAGLGRSLNQRQADRALEPFRRVGCACRRRPRCGRPGQKPAPSAAAAAAASAGPAPAPGQRATRLKARSRPAWRGRARRLPPRRRRRQRRHQIFDVPAEVGERRAVPMEPELIDDLFEPLGGSDERLERQLAPGAKNGAGRTGIGAGRAKLPGIAQVGFILGAAGEPHAGGGTVERQPLAPGAGPSRLRASKRSSKASAAPAWKAASASLGASRASAQAGTVGGVTTEVAIAGSRRIMLSRVKRRCALCHLFPLKTHSLPRD